MRVTPLRASTVIERYLNDMFEKERANNAEWQTLGEHEAVAWIVEDKAAETRCHYVLTGRNDVVILCSYAYDAIHYEDGAYDPAIAAGLELFAAAMQSLRF